MNAYYYDSSCMYRGDHFYLFSFGFDFICLRGLGSSFGVSSLLGFLGGSSCKASGSTSLSGLGLFGEGLLLDGNSLQFVNLLQKDRLILELVTLGQHVQVVVNVLVDLLGISHLLQKTTKDSDASHPQDLEGKTGVGSTSALTNTCVL